MTSRWMKRSEADKRKIYHDQEIKGAIPTAKIDNPFSPVTYVPKHLRAEAQKRFINEHFKNVPVEKAIDKLAPRPRLGMMTLDDWNAEANICKQNAWKILHALEEEEASKIPPQVREVCQKIANLWFRRGIICGAFGAFGLGHSGNDKFDKMIRSGKPNDYVVMFCSDNPTDQMNDPRVTYDPKTNTYEFDNLTRTYDEKKYGGLNKDILMDKYVPTAPGYIHGPRLIIIFKKSDPSIPPVVSPPQYVVVNKKPIDAPKPLDIKPTSPVVKCEPVEPVEHSLTSVEIFLIVCVSFIVIVHIIEITVWLHNKYKH